MAERSGFLGSVIETVKTIVYALLIAGAFRTILFQPFWIPSGSMKDTLLIGDFLFVNKFAYGYSYASCPSIPMTSIGPDDFCGMFTGTNERLFGSDPERGDVVVFLHPNDKREFIKRLIGLPGDKIQMKDGQLFINGVAVPQEPDGVFEEVFGPQGPQRRGPLCKNGAVGQGALCEKDKFIETLPSGRSYSVLNVGNGSTDNTGVHTVPEDHYFFMGDNRDNSTDSRVLQTANGVGFVPRANIVGRADRVMFSSAGRSMFAFWTWRPDRFFKAIE